MSERDARIILPALLNLPAAILREPPSELPQRYDYASAVLDDDRFAPQESRMTSLQSNRISRTGISGLVTRSSIAAIAATPISLHGWRTVVSGIGNSLAYST